MSVLTWVQAYSPTIIDVSLVYVLIYTSLKWLKNSQSFYVIRGIFVIGFIYVISDLLQFTTLNWVLGHFTKILLIILIILFQPELRRLLERLGRREIFSSFSLQGTAQSPLIIKQLLRAVDTLAKNKFGALIVIELGTNLDTYIETGIRVNATLTADVIASLFWPNSPTHDGALIIRQNKIEAIDCLLPLTDAVLTDRRLGTRHRAAIGLTEITDALVIIVSEETGVISLAEGGNLTRYLTKEALETRLFNLYTEQTQAQPFSLSQWFAKLLKS